MELEITAGFEYSLKSKETTQLILIFLLALLGEDTTNWNLKVLQISQN